LKRSSRPDPAGSQVAASTTAVSVPVQGPYAAVPVEMRWTSRWYPRPPVVSIPAAFQASKSSPRGAPPPRPGSDRPAVTSTSAAHRVPAHDVARGERVEDGIDPTTRTQREGCDDARQVLALVAAEGADDVRDARRAVIAAQAVFRQEALREDPQADECAPVERGRHGPVQPRSRRRACRAPTVTVDWAALKTRSVRSPLPGTRSETSSRTRVRRSSVQSTAPPGAAARVAVVRAKRAAPPASWRAERAAP